MLCNCGEEATCDVRPVDGRWRIVRVSRHSDNASYCTDCAKELMQERNEEQQASRRYGVYRAEMGAWA